MENEIIDVLGNPPVKKRRKRRKKLTASQLGQRRRRRNEKKAKEAPGVKQALVQAPEPMHEVFQTLGAARTLLAGVGYDREAAKQILDWLKNGQPDDPVHTLTQRRDK